MEFRRVLFRSRASEIWKERKGKTAEEKVGLYTPKEQAAEEIALKYNKPMTGPALMSAISSFKKDPLFGDGKARGK
mgnify:CR=1 FL=1